MTIALKKEVYSDKKVLFEKALEVLSEGIIIINEDYKIEYANEMAAIFLGTFSEELIGKKLYDMHSFRNKGEMQTILQQLLGGGLCFWEKTIFLQERFLNFQLRSINEKDTSSQGIVMAIYDVTAFHECKKAKEQIFKMHSTMFEHSHVGMYTIDAKGLITSLNPAAEQLWGVSKENTLNKPFLDIFFGGKKFNDNNEYLSVVIETLETGEEFHSIQKERIIDGKKHILLIDTCILRDSKGQLQGVMAVANDVTEYRNSLDELYRLEKYEIVSQMAAGLADEMRNPLTSVKGFMQLIQERMKRTRQKEYVDLALDELKRIEHLVRNFLLFSSPDTPILKLTSINRIIKDVLTSFQQNNANINFNCFVPGEEFFMCLDEEQIKQVIWNILQNSIEAIKSKGNIEVKVFLQKNEPRVGISIEDNGEGIDPERWPHIFEPFYTTKELNSGLGLTIAERIVTAHGGTISGKNNVIGGVTILVSLPFATYPINNSKASQSEII